MMQIIREYMDAPVLIIPAGIDGIIFMNTKLESTQPIRNMINR